MKTADGFCRCKRPRSECVARCSACGADGSWDPKEQDYRCEAHARSHTKGDTK